MKLKQTRVTPNWKIWQNKKALFISCLLCAVLYTSVVFFCGIYSHKLALDQTGVIRNTTFFIKAALHPYRLLTAKFNAHPERIYIDIKHKHFQKIAYKREVALKNGLLFTSGEDYVPATIRHGDKKLRVKLRLKGDLPDHWETDKWSLRIKIRGDNTLFGMKKFSLQHPLTRVYAGEWFALEALRREGIISVRYKFVDLTINGKHKGIYALEEHFEKRLIEHSEYKEGPIVKFNEDLRWMEYVSLQTHEKEYGSWSSSYIDGYSKDRSKNSLFAKATTLLEGFRAGQYKTTDVFNGKKLAFFIAMKDLLGASELDWNDFRFYYNPVTSLLEPIGFDFHFDGKVIKKLFSYAGGIKYKDDSWQQNPNSFIPLIFKDKEFFVLYNQALSRVSAAEYIDDLLKDTEQGLQNNLNIIHSEYPGFNLSLDAVYKNQQFIKKALAPDKGFHAYFYNASSGNIAVEMGNIQSMPIQVLGISHKKLTLFKPVATILLGTKKPSETVNYDVFRFVIPSEEIKIESVLADLKVNYRIVGTEAIRQTNIFPWQRINKNFKNNDLVRSESNVKQFNFISVNEEEKKIFIKPGSWNIQENLIIPKGYIVECGPGTDLNLSNFSSILSFSRFNFQGSENLPIIIRANSENSGKGLAILGTNEQSEFKYVRFQNLANPAYGGWKLSGAVTFYESPVKISNCLFSDNRSEDSLNLVRSNFTIKKSLFRDTFSDAVDIDFSDGEISDSVFNNCGNDGIDISGSVVSVAGIMMDTVGDKGLSAGEDSRLEGANILITDAEIAVASKDLSKVAVNNIQVKNCKIGFTVYQKKSEFGPGTMSIQNYKMDETKIGFLVEKESELSVNKKKIEPSGENVKGILYGAEYGKSSK